MKLNNCIHNDYETIKIGKGKYTAIMCCEKLGIVGKDKCNNCELKEERSMTEEVCKGILLKLIKAISNVYKKFNPNGNEITIKVVYEGDMALIECWDKDKKTISISSKEEVSEVYESN